MTLLRTIGRACLTKEGLACIALFAVIAGCGILSAQIGWLISILEAASAIEQLANVTYGLLAIQGMAFLSLTLLLGRRSIRAEFWKAKFEATNQSAEREP